MTFLSNIENWFETTEQDILNIIVKIKQGVKVVESDIQTALKWLADNTPAIASDIEVVLGIVQTVGIVNPEVEAAVTAANSAVAALDTYAAAYKSGQGTAQSVIAGYSAFKQAQAAAASATSVAVAAPVAAPK